MSKEKISRRAFIKRGLLVTAGIAIESVVVADLTQLENQISNEAALKYPFVKEVCGIAANSAGVSCRSEVKNAPRIEQFKILQEYQDFRAEIFLKNRGITRAFTGLAAAMIGAAIISKGLTK